MHPRACSNENSRYACMHVPVAIDVRTPGFGVIGHVGTQDPNTQPSCVARGTTLKLNLLLREGSQRRKTFVLVLGYKLRILHTLPMFKYQPEQHKIQETQQLFRLTKFGHISIIEVQHISSVEVSTCFDCRSFDVFRSWIFYMFRLPKFEHISIVKEWTYFDCRKFDIRCNVCNDTV